jgi:hypothetical protein
VVANQVISSAHNTFMENLKDIQRLWTMYKEQTGTRKQRLPMRNIINRSTVVLVTAYWEAFCEDLVSEGLDHLISYCSSSDEIPVELRKVVARDLKKDVHELAVWTLAGDNWRTVLNDRKKLFEVVRNRGFNTPKAANIDWLFRQALGIRRISENWYWEGVTAEGARAALDNFIELRGEIAHRGRIDELLTKERVKTYVAHVNRLAHHTASAVSDVLWQATGKVLLTTQYPDGEAPPAQLEA